MKNWRTEKTLYEVHEINRTKHEIYHMVITGNEMIKWCKTKNAIYGGSRVDGGDPSYTCWAVMVNY